MNEITRNETTSTPDDADVVVIGAGLAGLTAAATIAAAGKRVVVREKLGVPGGDARSTENEGFTFNHGPHAVYRNGPVDRVLTKLGVQLAGGTPPVKGRLVIEGVAYVAPAGAPTLIQTKAFPFAAKLEIVKVLALLPRQRADEHRQLSAEQWVDTLVSHDLAKQYLLSLVRLTTYSNHPGVLSADVAISQIQSALTDGVLYLDGGWQTLVDQLAALPGVNIEVGDAVTELPDARAVIIAAGGPSLAAKLLETTFDVGPPAHVSVVDFGLRRRPDHDVVIGGDVAMYFSNHSSVAKLAPAHHFHASAMQYLGEGDSPDHTEIRAFAGHAGVREDDVVVSRRLHQMTAVSAIPTAAGGGLAGRPKVGDTGHDNVFIAGDWVGPVGHLADGSVASGEAAAVAALTHLNSRVVS